MHSPATVRSTPRTLRFRTFSAKKSRVHPARRTRADPFRDFSRQSLLRRGDELGEQVEIDGLGDVMVEAGGPRALPVVLLAVAGRGDEHGVPEALIVVEHRGDLVTVQAGQPDVEEEDFG